MHTRTVFYTIMCGHGNLEIPRDPAVWKIKERCRQAIPCDDYTGPSFDQRRDSGQSLDLHLMRRKRSSFTIRYCTFVSLVATVWIFARMGASDVDSRRLVSFNAVS